jgi:hypothetical protein
MICVGPDYQADGERVMEETFGFLQSLISLSEAHRKEQLAAIQGLGAEGQPTKEARQVLRRIEDTLTALRRRNAEFFWS